MQGFLPQRQLVLVDLLAMMLAVRPGERATVAIDGAEGVGRTHLAAELVTLAQTVAGRPVLLRSVDEAGGGAGCAIGEAAGADASDALVLAEGTFLRRPDFRGRWDATCLVLAQGIEAPQSQRLLGRTWQPDWIVDNTDLQRPELLWPDPDEPQWF